METVALIKAEIERLRKANEISEDKEYAQYELDVMCGYDSALDDLLSFIESLEKKPKGKTNPLFEECLANVDPAVRKEVHENIDKMLDKEKEKALKDLVWEKMEQDGDVDHFVRKELDEVALKYAKLGAEWGCRNTAVLYDDMEKERQRRCESEPTIKGWVARDKAEEFEKIGYLHLFASKPHREYGCSWIGTCCYLCLDKTMFPSLKWEDGPIEVELTIHRV